MSSGRPGIAVWIATCGGLGHFPFAPGTIGSAVGVGLAVVVRQLPLERAWLTVALGLLAVVLFSLGVWAAEEGEIFFSRTDPRQVVIDEVTGQVIALLACPDTRGRWVLAGFLLFRAFDVVKPFPARRAERVAGGWGIMLDDVVAGAYSVMALLLLKFLIR